LGRRASIVTSVDLLARELERRARTKVEQREQVAQQQLERATASLDVVHDDEPLVLSHQLRELGLDVPAVVGLRPLRQSALRRAGAPSPMASLR
jgi:hypothetical protein